MRPIRALLLDATGTLIETREPIGETYARVAGQFGVPISAWRIGDAFKRAMTAAPPLVFPGAAPQAIPALERDWWRERVRTTLLSADSARRPSDFEACFETLFRHFASARAWRLCAGVRPALDALADEQGLRLAVVSNFDHRLRGLLEELGIAGRFECVVLPGDCGAAKPDPVIFRHALDALGVDPEQALFAGDDAERDLPGARRLGMAAVDVGALATLAELPALVAREAGARSHPAGETERSAGTAGRARGESA